RLMILTLLAWAYTSILCFIAGRLLMRLLFRTPEERASIQPFPVVCLAGILVVSSVLGVLSLFMKLGAAANAVLAAPALAAAVLDRRRLIREGRESLDPLLSAGPASRVLLGPVLLLILWCSTEEPLHFDTGLYHAQAVRWSEEAPAVPGLGNLHGRLAFN